MECYIVKARKHITHKSIFSPNQLDSQKNYSSKREKKKIYVLC